MDSMYPLMTKDETLKKEYTLKITDDHLDKVFGGTAKRSEFNL
jgi:hypothetical protein